MRTGQQLQLDEPSQKMLTINTHKGLYQPKRIMFGIHAASGIFQREMDKRLSGIPYTVVRVDDILVSGANDAEHLKNLEQVMTVLRDNGLRLNQGKCVFMQPEVCYLGFNISREGVRVLPDKIKAIVDAPSPRDVTQVKSWLGAVNYYHRHMPNMSSDMEPLHRLLRKGQEWKWGAEQEAAFCRAKELLTKAPLLVHFDATLPIKLHCDASSYGLGARPYSSIF